MENKELLQTIYDNINIWITILEPVYAEHGEIRDFRIIFVNREFVKDTKRDDLIGKLFSEEYPGIKTVGLFDMLIAVMKKGQAEQYEYYYPYEGFNKWFSSVFIRIKERLLLTTSDISARKIAELELMRNRDLQQAVFRTVRHSIVVLQALRDKEGKIHDFIYTLSNGVAERYVGTEIGGKTLRNVIPGYRDEENFRIMVDVIETGNPAERVGQFEIQGKSFWIYSQYNKMEDCIVIVHEDITIKKIAEEEVKKSHEQLNAIFEAMPLQLVYFRAAKDADGNFEDFVVENINESALRQHGLNRTELLQKNFSQFLDKWKDKSAWKLINKVYYTGKIAREETQYVSAGHQECFLTTVLPFRDGVLLSQLDITERKNAEKQLEESKQFIEKVTNSMSGMLYVLDLKEKKFVYINERVKEFFGIEVEKYSSIGPEIFKNTAHSGDYKKRIQHLAEIKSIKDEEIRELEMRFKTKEGNYQWFRITDRLFKRDKNNKAEQIIGITTDITESKQAHGQLIKQEALLREAEKIGQIGSWELNIGTSELIWSDQLYEIFCMEAGMDGVRAEMFKGFILPDDLQKISEGSKNTEHKLEVGSLEFRSDTIHGEKILYSEYKILYNKKGTMDFVRGIVRDITRQKQAEEELIRLRLNQQKEILNAVLLAQEKERENIGEGLHNGVGQLLYAAQIKAEQLKKQFPEKELVKELIEILGDAIHETRNISFELVPTVLRDFGLEKAIPALLKRLVKNGLEVQFHTWGIKERLPENFEIGIYRIIQELLNNLVRHSQASVGAIKINKTDKKILVEVCDNGIGFDQQKTLEMHKGIGLQSIRNRAKLMNAHMLVEGGPSLGTKISVSIPIE